MISTYAVENDSAKIQLFQAFYFSVRGVVHKVSPLAIHNLSTFEL